MKKDKQKVLDEVWTEDHVRSFLNVRPHDESNELFVRFFGEQNRNINAQDREGRTALEIISGHRRGGDYAAILQAAGAT